MEIDVLQGFAGSVHTFPLGNLVWMGRVQNFAGDIIVWTNIGDNCRTRNEVELLLRDRLAEWRETNEQAS
jgi:hypothetical protein